MVIDWDNKVRVYWSSQILKTIEGKELKKGDNMNTFENIVIGNIEYLNKMLVICYKFIINNCQIKADKLRILYKLKSTNIVN